MSAPLTIPIEAQELIDGDWVEGEGIVKEAIPAKTVVVVFSRKEARVYEPGQEVVIRLEDHGEKG